MVEVTHPKWGWCFTVIYLQPLSLKVIREAHHWSIEIPPNSQQYCLCFPIVIVVVVIYLAGRCASSSSGSNLKPLEYKVKVWSPLYAFLFYYHSESFPPPGVFQLHWGLGYCLMTSSQGSLLKSYSYSSWSFTTDTE